MLDRKKKYKKNFGSCVADSQAASSLEEMAQASVDVYLEFWNGKKYRIGTQFSDFNRLLYSISLNFVISITHALF